VSYKDIILRKLGHGLVLGHINLDPLRSSGKSFGTRKWNFQFYRTCYRPRESYFLQSYFLQSLSQSLS